MLKVKIQETKKNLFNLVFYTLQFLVGTEERNWMLKALFKYISFRNIEHCIIDLAITRRSIGCIYLSNITQPNFMLNSRLNARLFLDAVSVSLYPWEDPEGDSMPSRLYLGIVTGLTVYMPRWQTGPCCNVSPARAPCPWAWPDSAFPLHSSPYFSFVQQMCEN